MASLRDIADEVSVSVSLVSKVLNNRLGTSGARAEVSQQILDAAQRLGYRKNASAAALQTGRQHAIAVIVHRHGVPGSGLVEDLLAGIADAARLDQQRQIIEFYEDVEDFARIVRSLHHGLVDGLLIAGVRHPSVMDEVVAVQQRQLPVVTILTRPISDTVVNVGMSEDRIMRTATRHLLAQGRRRILHVCSSRHREAGYLAALAEAGVEADPTLIVDLTGNERRYTQAEGVEAVRRAFAAGTAFDAVCAQSDAQATGALHELLRRGVRVPEEVMVTGVDDSPFAKLAFVPLTSVDQRYEQRGRKAVHLLGELMEGRGVSSVNFKPRLAARDSTAGGEAD